MNSINHPHQWFGGRTYAQHGDDLALLNLFGRMHIENPSYLDIGAHHPFDLSNTALLYQRGSRGINVEANPDLIEKLKEFRPEDINLCFAVMGTMTLDATVQLYRHNTTSGINSTVRDNLDGYGIQDTIDVPTVTVPGIMLTHCNGQWPDLLNIDVEGRDLEILNSIEQPQFKVICAEAVSQMGDITVELKKWALVNGYFLHSWCGSNVMLVHVTMQSMVY